MWHLRERCVCLLVLTLVLLLIGTQSGPAPSTGPVGGSIVLAASTGPVRAAITLPFAPWQYKDKSGKLTGFEVEMLREVGKRLNRKVEFMNVQWEGIFAGLTVKKYDIIASAIVIICERQKVYDFSVPYYDSGVSITVRKGDNRIQRVEDLKGMVVGVGGSGTSSHIWLTQNKDKYEIKEIKIYDTMQAGMLDLQVSRIDADAENYPSAAFYVKDKPDLEVRLRGLTATKTGLIFRKRDPLVPQVNAAIDALKKDGTMARLHREHFGFEAPADSPAVQVLSTVPMPADCK